MTRVRRVLPWLAAAAFVLAAFGATPWIVGLLRAVEELGPAGHALFAALYVLATLCVVPAAILEGAAGFLYGPLWGVLVASGLGTASASVAFLLGRGALRPAVERRIAGDPRLERIATAVARDGARLVFWLRLSPLAPFNALHMPLGASRIGLAEFAAATAIGHLFPVLMFVSIGTSVDSLTALTDHAPALPPWAVAAGLATGLVASVAVTRIARRALAEAGAGPP